MKRSLSFFLVLFVSMSVGTQTPHQEYRSSLYGLGKSAPKKHEEVSASKPSLAPVFIAKATPATQKLHPTKPISEKKEAAPVQQDKKQHAKPKHPKNAVREPKSLPVVPDGPFTGPLPLLASVGAAILLGGITYYAMPTPSSARSGDLFNSDQVKVIHPSDLTPEQLEVLMHAEGFEAHARDFGEAAAAPVHQESLFTTLARKFMEFIMPQFMKPQHIVTDSRDYGHYAEPHYLDDAEPSDAEH